MNIYFLNPPIGTEVVNLDYSYMLFTATCPEHHWPHPIIDWANYQTIDDIVDEILSHDPHVVLMSIYIWNESLCSDVASELKRRVPQLPILVGGPQIKYDVSYFDLHPGFDLICTQYGEHFLPPALTQIEEHGYVNDPLEIPWALSKEGLSPHRPTFVWSDANIVLDSLEYVMAVRQYADEVDNYVTFNYETTRGCPFMCSYCEWGGGTNTKVIAKPYALIEEELTMLLPMGVDLLAISDANFGILKRDADIIDLAAELRDNCGHPGQFISLGFTKTKTSQRERVLDRLFYHRFDDHFYISFQSINPRALKINQRRDISQSDYFSLYNQLRERYGIVAKLECILGLPGADLTDYYHEMDLIQYLQGWQYGINVFYLLPNVEAYGDEYRQANLIKTFPTRMPYSEEFREADKAFHDPTILAEYRSPCEVVCESLTYTRWEWMEMHVLGTIQSLYGEHLTRLASVVVPRLWQWMTEQVWFSPILAHYEQLFAGTHEKDFVTLGSGEYLFDYLRRHLGDIPQLIASLEFDTDPLPHNQTSVDQFLKGIGDTEMIKVVS